MPPRITHGGWRGSRARQAQLCLPCTCWRALGTGKPRLGKAALPLPGIPGQLGEGSPASAQGLLTPGPAASWNVCPKPAWLPGEAHHPVTGVQSDSSQCVQAPCPSRCPSGDRTSIKGYTPKRAGDTWLLQTPTPLLGRGTQSTAKLQVGTGWPAWKAASIETKEESKVLFPGQPLRSSWPQAARLTVQDQPCGASLGNLRPRPRLSRGEMGLKGWPEPGGGHLAGR